MDIMLALSDLLEIDTVLNLTVRDESKKDGVEDILFYVNKNGKIDIENLLGNKGNVERHKTEDNVIISVSVIITYKTEDKETV